MVNFFMNIGEVFFYLGKSTFSILAFSCGFVKVVSQQSELCVFRCADFGWRTFYYLEEKMFDFICLVVIVADGFLVGKLLGAISKGVFGDKPLGRLIRLIASLGGGIGYSMWAAHIGYGDSDISLGLGAAIIFGPVAILGLLCLLAYIFEGK